MQDRVRTPQPLANPPTGHQISQQGLAQNAQKCQFGSFLAKNLNFYWKKQKFVLVPTLRKNHLRILFALFFGQAWDKMGQKYKYLAQNDQKCQFWAKFGGF